MRELGRVVSGHPYELPEGWDRAGEELLDGALARARSAIAAEVAEPADGSSRLERYFDPSGRYAGALFNTLDRARAGGKAVTATDLLAVSMLNVHVDPMQVRQLVEDHPKRESVNRALAAVPHDAALADFADGTHDVALVLERLHELYGQLRTTPSTTSNRWVFASKLCARKLPHLMPVRDTVVCTFLAGAPLSSRAGTMGHVKTDLQAFAFVMSDPEVRADLKTLGARLRERHGPTMYGVPPLRILDVVLWTAGIGAGPGRSSQRVVELGA